MRTTQTRKDSLEERAGMKQRIWHYFLRLIARALSKLSDNKKMRLGCKFDFAYIVATGKILFKKYPQICELEARHWVDL